MKMFQFLCYYNFDNKIRAMLTKKDDQQPTTITKRSYSYNDLVKLETNQAYSSMGRMIISEKPSNPRTTFGKFQRDKRPKQYQQKQLMKMYSGKDGNGPASYLPSRFHDENGKQIVRKDLQNAVKYDTAPSFSVGKSPKKPRQGPIYNYMHSKNDKLELNQADLKRRNSTPNVRIGVDQRFPDQRPDKITPGPTYDPKLKPNAPEAPKYTLGARRKIPGQDPLVPSKSTTALVGPSTYFQRGGKSHSTSSLSRVPYDSKIKNQPVVSFAKGPKSLAAFKSSIDQTYDLKTNTIMAHYDFEYDAGKGLNSGRAWDKKFISNSSKMPLQKNKMKSYTIGKSSRQKQHKRGTFIGTMSFVPASVKLSVPKF